MATLMCWWNRPFNSCRWDGNRSFLKYRPWGTGSAGPPGALQSSGKGAGSPSGDGGHGGRDSGQLEESSGAVRTKRAGAAWSFLERGLAHCLATDGHRPGDITPENIHRMKRALIERLGKERTRILVEENPARVWAGAPLENITPVKIARKKKPGRRWFKWPSKAEQ